MLNTLERVEPGPQSQGWEGWKLGTSAGWTDNSQGLGRRMRSSGSSWCAEEEGMKLELGRRGWGLVTDGRRDARRRRLRGAAQPRPGRRTLTRVPPQGTGGLLPQLREQEVARGLQVLEGAELDDGTGHGCRDPGRQGCRSLATPGPPDPAVDSTEPRELQTPGGAGTQDRKLSASPGRRSQGAAQARTVPELRVREATRHTGKGQYGACD